jgi:hypothetical protein
MFDRLALTTGALKRDRVCADLPSAQSSGGATWGSTGRIAAWRSAYLLLPCSLIAQAGGGVSNSRACSLLATTGLTPMAIAAKTASSPPPQRDVARPCLQEPHRSATQRGVPSRHRGARTRDWLWTGSEGSNSYASGRWVIVRRELAVPSFRRKLECPANPPEIRLARLHKRGHTFQGIIHVLDE